MIGEHEDRFERKLPLAVVEEVFETWPEQVNDHDVVVAFDAEPVHVGNAH